VTKQLYAFQGLVGAILCGFSKEDGVIPVNKNLYSLSFVLVNSGIDFLFLTLLYFLIDVKHIWSGSPFYFTGNSIFKSWIEDKK
jgi:heparan-alpha-glucosaminide N-acetyltransferase